MTDPRTPALRLVACCLVLLSVCGCRLRQGDMTVLSNRNVNLDRIDLDKLKRTRVTGEDKGFYFLGIPFARAQLEDAVDDALKKADGDLLTDVVVHTSYIWVILGVIETLEVEGDAVRTRSSTQRVQQ